MRKLFLISILSTFTVATGAAQNDFPFLKLNAVLLGFNIVASGDESLSFDKLSELAKDPSTFLPIDLSSYHNGKYQIKIVEGGTVIFQSPTGKVDDQKLITHSRFDLQAAFNIYKKSRGQYSRHLELRLGIFYQPYYYQQANYVQTEDASDDSSIYHYVYYDALTPILGIQGAFLYRTDQEKWISGYTGIGIGTGLSTHPQVAETFGTMTSKTTTDTSTGVAFPVYNFSVISNTQNIFPGKSSFLLESKILLGVNVRVFKECYVFAEGGIVGAEQFFFNGPAMSQGLTFSGAAGIRIRVI